MVGAVRQATAHEDVEDGELEGRGFRLECHRKVTSAYLEKSLFQSRLQRKTNEQLTNLLFTLSLNSGTCRAFSNNNKSFE
jgi:hypothetical protein